MTDQETITAFFAEFDRRIENAPDSDYAQRLLAMKPPLVVHATLNPAEFAQSVVQTLDEMS